MHEKLADEGCEDEANHLSELDVKKKQVIRGRYLFWLAYQSVGVIFGDIGTSPLYVYSSTFSSSPSYDDLLGALSLIIWTITLMVSVKYVVIVLRADDEGEGGTFAIYSLLSRYANIVRRDPREERLINMHLDSKSSKTRTILERSVFLKTTLKVVGVLGVSLVMSDGILTPAQSVLGAIQGLKIVDDGISTATIVGTSCGILVLLFLIQPFGTSKIGSTFAPIVITWLGFNFCFGIYNLVEHDHSVLRAFSPGYAGQYLTRNKIDGWKSLGGILLAFTGVEALFADLGAFSRRAIQISWLCFAYPCLLLAYIGQAAYISDYPEAVSNPFFNAVPPGMFYPSLVVAILAGVVASQTMITATFQLLSQIIKLSYFPQIKVTHTSKIFEGQIYIPFVNWLLMVGTIIVTVAYNNTTKLGEAYGVCVILVTFITTSMVSLVALIIWRFPMPIVIFAFLTFGGLDGVYLSSALTKVPDGAWFTLILGILLSSIFVLWRFGKENQWQAEASDHLKLSSIIATESDDQSGEQGNITPRIRFTSAIGHGHVSSINGMGIFFDKSGLPDTTPTVFIHFIQKFQTTPRVVVFFHIRPLSSPSVPLDERFTVSRCFGRNIHGLDHQFFRVTLRHGYTDEVISQDLGLQIYEQLRSFAIRECASKEQTGLASASMNTSRNDRGDGIASISFTSPENSEEQVTGSEAKDGGTTISPSPEDTWVQQERVRGELATLEAAYKEQVVYIVGKEQMRIREVKGCKPRGWFRRIALAAFLWLRSNTSNKVANLNVDIDKLVEIGFVKII